MGSGHSEASLSVIEVDRLANRAVLPRHQVEPAKTWKVTLTLHVVSLMLSATLLTKPCRYGTKSRTF